MKKIALVLTLISILAMAPVVYAHDNQARGGAHFKLNSQQSGENENEFRIMGVAESVEVGSFVVGGTTILIDPSQVDEFKQKGILDDGDWVKVEGEIIGEDYYAEEIMTIGEGQGRFKFEVDSENDEDEDEGEPTVTPTETPTASPTETVSITPTVSISPTESPTETPSPTPTETSNIEVNVSAHGPIALVTQFLQQVLTYLEGLIS